MDLQDQGVVFPFIMFRFIFFLCLLFSGTAWAGEKPFTIVLGGDTMLGRLVDKQIPLQNSDYFFGDVGKIFREADLAVVNLEFSITRHSEKNNPAKAFHFRARPAVTKILRHAGIDMVALANNHVMDFGVKGLDDTMKYLQKADILFAGAGPNWDKSISATIWDNRVALIAMTDNMPDWKSGANQAGIFYHPLNIFPEFLAQQIKALKNSGHLVILSLHWGPNWVKTPSRQYVNFAHQAIDAGADIIFGHSPHTIQKMELYHDKPIFYSTADLIDDYAVKQEFRNDLGFIAKLTYNQKLRSIEIIPTKIADFQVNRAQGAEAEWVLKTLQMGLCQKPSSLLTNPHIWAGC